MIIGWYSQEDTEDECLEDMSDEIPEDGEICVQIQINKEETTEEENDND